MEYKEEISKEENVTTESQVQENAQNDTPLPVITQTTDETQTPTILSTDQSNNDQQTTETVSEILPKTPEIFNTPTDDSIVPGFMPGVDAQQISTNFQPTSPINKPPVNQANEDTPVETKDNESLTTNLDSLTGPQLLNPIALSSSQSGITDTRENLQEE